MIRATAADLPEIEAFLRNHIATSMFPLTSLRHHGMENHHPRGQRFWLRWQAARITDVLAISNAGYVIPQCPTGPWGDVTTILAGQKITGIIGEAGQVAALRAVLRFNAAAEMDTVQPLFQLLLDAIFMPNVTGFDLISLQDAPLDLIQGWRAAYCEETMALSSEEAVKQAAQDINAYMKEDNHRVLLHDGKPVATTGFNASLPQIVQIGGVYTPPDLRGRGYGRRAVAMHISQVKKQGVSQAVLFAASAAAAKAYEAIGFRHTGAYSMVRYNTPQVIYG